MSEDSFIFTCRLKECMTSLTTSFLSDFSRAYRLIAGRNPGIDRS